MSSFCKTIHERRQKVDQPIRIRASHSRSFLSFRCFIDTDPDVKIFMMWRIQTMIYDNQIKKALTVVNS